MGDVKHYNIADLFEHTVDVVPDRTALIVRRRAGTFAELDERANRLAHHLVAAGRRGPATTSASTRHNSLEWIETMLAIFKIRAVPININYRYVEDELPTCSTTPTSSASSTREEFAPRVAAVIAEPAAADARWS